jgi:hypothetical protein
VSVRDGLPNLTRDEVIERMRAVGVENLQPYVDLLCRSMWICVDPTRQPGALESRFGGPAMVREDFGFMGRLRSQTAAANVSFRAA